MYQYLMEVQRWFGKWDRFKVLAYSNGHAMMTGQMYLEATEPNYQNEYHMGTLAVVRRLYPI